MIEQFLAIARNTFLESIRQPITLVILLIAIIGLVLSNPLSAFTMENDQRMLIDIGLATVFLAGTLLAAFVATNVLTREIDNKTVLTVISKPVGRPVFVIGKFFGVAGAIVIGTLLLSFAFLLTEQHAVLQTTRDPVHVPVVVFGLAALILGAGIGVWCNYFYNKVFASTVIIATTPLAGLAYFLSLLFKPDFSFQDPTIAFKPYLWLALICIMVAVLVLTAIAVAASTRLNQVLTLVVTVGVFMLGLMSDSLLGTRIDQLQATWLERATAEGLTETMTEERSITLITGERTVPAEYTETIATVPLYKMADGAGEVVQYGLLWIGYAIVPNFQTLLLSDALTQNHVIPLSYVARAILYGVFYIIAALSAAVILFQRREVG